jgi:biopolymer transport protein ExbB
MPFATRLAAIAMLALALFAPTTASAWWNDEWANRMRIVVGGPAVTPSGNVGAETTPAQAVGRTRILVRLHQGNFNFNTAKEDGTDIRFVAGDDKTQLRFYVEKYDSLADQQGFFWVDVPDLSIGAAGTPIHLYWGNKNAPPAGAAAATFDTDTVLAFDFRDDAGAPRDSTGFGNNATSATRRDDGLVAFGARFDGTASVRIPAGPTIAWGPGGPLTWSFWVRPDAGVTEGVLYQARDGGNVVTIALEGGAPYAEIQANGATVRTPAMAPLTPESWRHVAVVAANDRLAVFVDGRPAGDVAANLPAMSGAAALGARLPPPEALVAAPPPVVPPAAPGVAPGAAAPPVAAAVPDPAPRPGFQGVMDVVRIAKAARAPVVFEVAVRGEGPAGSLLRFDVAEEGSIFGTGHFGIIARNLTIDAWVVIGICLFLMPVTWLIFGVRAAYVSSSVKANRIFRAAFRDSLSRAGTRGFAGMEGLADANAHRRFRKSSLYRFYRTALDELEARGGVARAGHLSTASLASIRASVDAQITGEQLRMNGGIVMLTIAISGGPFIGLLGTVIGVMITFAAVAAAGDVNVNAIAPGISAALAATVAGLAVAIPALFGYNYLQTRNRDINADMRVFADELVTRIGEGGTTAPDTIPMLKAAE